MRRSVLLCIALAATVICQAPLEDLPPSKKPYVDIRNAEFLMTGGIDVPNDKYWCLHKTVYREPVDNRASTAPQPQQQSLNKPQQGRKLDEEMSCDSACSSMADYLCSDSHLTFTDNSLVCTEMALSVGLDWTMFYTVEQFRRKVAFSINYVYRQLRTNGKQPRSAWDMRQPRFLKRCRDQLKVEMKKVLYYIPAADIEFAHSNNMDDVVISYVNLNVENLFFKDRRAAIAAWEHAYSNFKDKCNGKRFSQKSVRYFIEAIKLRYKPRTDIPTPDVKAVGKPVIGPKTSHIPPTKLTFPEVYQTPKTEVITFEYYENPIDYEGYKPWLKSGDKHNHHNPKNPTKKQKKPEGEVPPNILEHNNFVPPQNVRRFPQQKPSPHADKKTKVEKDRTIPVEIIEIQRSWNIQKALLTYGSLTQSMREDIKACRLSLKPAIGRCENIHGKGQCEAITPTFVGPKCPKGMVREGSRNCVTACPFGFKSETLFCHKPKSYFINPRKTQKECWMANARECEKVEGEEVYTAKCSEDFKRVGSALCVAECPKGTQDMGDKCLRKHQETGEVFLWAAGDE